MPADGPAEARGSAAWQSEAEDLRAFEVRIRDVASPGFLEFAAMVPTCVLFVSSLEEIGDDVHALRQAAAVLAPGGRVVVFASALPGITGTLDRVYGQRRYGARELPGKLEAAGLRVVMSRYVNLLGALAWMWDSLVVRRTTTPGSSYGRRDLMVPAARFVDALTGPPIGRSLLAVGEKGGTSGIMGQCSGKN